MGIAGITIGFINLMNGCLGSSIIAESAEEVLLESSLNGIGHFISTGFRQSGEPFPNLCIVFAGQQIQQPFQIAGNQNIHRRRASRIEFPIPVVNAGVDEIGQNLVDVGCTNQLAERHAHLFCIVSSEDVAEVTSRNNDVQGFAHFQFALLYQCHIRGHIVNNLRNEPSPVDRIGTGEPHISGSQFFLDGLVGKDFLNTALAVVKVALYGTHVDIAAFLCYHLPLLHIAHAIFRIEDHDFCAFYILEAFKSSLAGVAGSCNQNDNFFFQLQLLHGCGQEIRQNLQCHILECTGWAMPQFEHVSAFKEVCNFCDIFCFKPLGVISTFGAVNQFCFGEIGQITRKYKCCPLCIGLICQSSQFFLGNRRNLFRYEQTAISRNPLRNRNGTFYPYAAISCTFIIHNNHPFPILSHPAHWHRMRFLCILWKQSVPVLSSQLRHHSEAATPSLDSLLHSIAKRLSQCEVAAAERDTPMGSPHSVCDS